MGDCYGEKYCCLFCPDATDGCWCEECLCEYCDWLEDHECTAKVTKKEAENKWIRKFTEEKQKERLERNKGQRELKDYNI